MSLRYHVALEPSRPFSVVASSLRCRTWEVLRARAPDGTHRRLVASCRCPLAVDVAYCVDHSSRVLKVTWRGIGVPVVGDDTLPFVAFEMPFIAA